ncbi:hypothetical protein C8J55DRAFT_65928 [Lentinula edodes]|uniref:Uncharacterized protein n=1 Tax=Lentinula lateritia TaxID=40482 RepID=A0A9W9DPP9_9AGAR|nr:hypothetical protein C8J55DRAFT_65928 [Lentinula edodes]
MSRQFTSSSSSQLEPSFCSPTKPKRSPNRAASLRLCNAKTVNVPIPPSLLQSPYLNSPMSPFQKANSTPCTPSREDEQWLRDTIPLSTRSASLGRSASIKENSQRQTCSSPKCSDIDTAERGEIIDKTVRNRIGPYSPPLVRLGARQPDQDKAQIPSLHLCRSGEQEYFLFSHAWR